MGMISEFKTFAMKGNLVDMASGIIIGAAIGKVVSSLVNDVIMPPIGVLLGGVNFTDLAYVIQQASGGDPEVAIRYGAFLQTIIDFLIIGFTVFVIIKLMNRAMNKPEEPEEKKPTESEALLGEIRDLLRSGAAGGR